MEEGKHNDFRGNLKQLGELTKLKRLDISNTDIDSGLENLPKSLEELICKSDKRDHSSCQKIERELEPYGGDIKK